jgi:hypothetical protein
MRDRDDHAAAGKHVGRIAWVARRGVETERVLDAHLRRAELGQVAEDAIGFGQWPMPLAPVIGVRPLAMRFAP